MNVTDHNGDRHRLARDGEHPRGDLGQLILLALFLAVWVLDSFVIRFSTAPAGFVPLGIRLAAAGLILLGAVRLAGRGHVVISGDNLRRDRLIKDGVFARVRHPLYLAALLFYAALLVATLSLIIAALFGGIFVFYNAIASYEENVLLRKHGEEYREYRRRVPKWLPRLRAAKFD